MNLQEPQRKAYDAYMQNMSYQQSMLWSSREEGRGEGRREEKIAIARNLLEHGTSPELVAASTGLSFEEIDSLRQG
jgi:predicted transposase/invertase (TIGR01784 family)